MVVQEFVILWRDNAADSYEDIFTAEFLQVFDDSREQGLMTCCQGREADHMNVVVDGILCRFFRSLEERAYVDVPAHICEGGSKDFLASVVTILAHLREEDTRAAAFESFEFVSQFLCFVQFGGVIEFIGVYAGNGVDDCIEAAGYLFNSVRDFAKGCTVMCCLNSSFQKVAVFTGFCTLGDGFQIAADSFRIADASEFFQTFDLCVTYSGVIDGENVQRIFLRQSVLVQADNGFTAGVDICLTTSGAFFDTHLRKACGDSLGHAAQCFDFLNVCPCTFDDLVGEVFHIVGAAPWIDDLADFGFILDVKLGVTSQTSREVGRQSDCFVECVGMQGLGVTERCRHSFHTGTADVVEWILFGEGPAGGLGVGTECHGFRILCAEAFEDLCPEDTSCTHLCDFHEVVLALIPEEGQTLCESIDRQTCFFAAADVFHTVCQRVTDFQIAGSAAFLNVVARNGNGVELRHVLGGVFENITNDTHGHSRWVNVGVTYHEFLQDIVLNGTCKDLLVDALFDAGGNEECQDRKNGAVHGHRYGHLVQRDAVEEDVHIKHGAYGYAGFTYVADNARVIRIVAAVGRKVECNGQTLLTCCQVSLIECVGFFCRGEACVLTNGPWAENVHGGVWSTKEWRDTAHEVQMIAVIIDIFGIEGSDRDLFHGRFIECIKAFAGLGFQLFLPLIIGAVWMFPQRQLCEIRICVCHYSIIPFFFCSMRRIS